MAYRGIEIGTEFGRLKVKEKTKIKKCGRYQYLCECKCGKTIIVEADRLRKGETQSCGCLRDELFEINKRKAYNKIYVHDTSLVKIANNTINKNNTSSVRGVSWDKKVGKWRVRIMFQKKTYSLGYYESIEDAKKVRQSAEKQLFGEFLEWYNSKYTK